MARAAALLIALAFAAAASGAEIVAVSQDASEVPTYGRIEIGIELADAYDNPDNPDEVEVRAEVTTPTGAVIEVPAFWFEPYAPSLEGGREVWTPDGEGRWCARYAPTETGAHTLVVVASDDAGQDVAGSLEFTAGPPASRGFVGVDPENPRYFAYDDGTSYVPLGVNVDWVREPSGSFAYLGYLDDLAADGGNWTRLWMSHFGEGTTLEWGAYHWTGYYAGLGRYSPQVAAKLDRIFAEAEARGVLVQLVLHQHSQFEASMWSSWAENPYNAANGGPCATSADYFTDPLALSLARRLHRYVVARYAAYRSLLAYEIFNEADLITGVGPSLMAPWAQSAAAEIRALDPHGRPVTTSYGIPYTLPTQDLTTWDFNNRHEYLLGSWMVGAFLDGYRAEGTPLLLSEYGIDVQGAQNARDPQGVNMHNGIWLALMHGYAGGAMNWWWDDYVAPNGLWRLNRAPAAFVAGQDMSRFEDDAEATATDAGRALDAPGIAHYVDGVLAEAWLWVHDPRSEWWGPADPPPIAAARLDVLGVDPERAARWRAEVVDAWSGALVVTLSGVSEGSDRVSFVLPRFARDVAVKLSVTREPVDEDDDGGVDITPADDAAEEDEGGCGWEA
jgi:hypothetical protein